MKGIPALYIFMILMLSCAKENKKQGDFKLLPQPQQFSITGVSDLDVEGIRLYYAESETTSPVFGKPLKHLKKTETVSKAQLILKIDRNLDLGPEGYALDISNKMITITGKDESGLFYGTKTLEQLWVDANEQDVNLPLCNITDYPLLAYRAIHLDVKHHLEKTDYYYDLIDKLASYKVNGIIAEMEDKLGYKRQPKIASADALSIVEWKALSNYAKERHIEISPLIQGLGHASFILKHQGYHHLRDDPSSDWAFNPLDPETYKVQFDLYLDAIEATPHGLYLHVGGDEVHTTGRNSGKSALELQLDWLKKVADFAEKHGRIPIFWDDMPLKEANVYQPMFQPELTQDQVDKVWEENEHKLSTFLGKFPKNCIYMRWNYSSPEALGNIKAMEWFRKHGLEVMGATAGQTRWTLMPQEQSNMENIKSFALNSIESGSKGLLLTLWDDDSPHFELYNRGIVAFAEYTWSGDKRDKETIKSVYRQREFSNELEGSEYAFIDHLEGPVAFWKNALLQGNKRNYLKTMDNALKEGIIDLPDNDGNGQWSAAHADRLEQAAIMLARCDSITKKINEIKAKTVRNRYTLEVYEQVNDMARFAPEALLALEDYDNAESPSDKKAALKVLQGLNKKFNELRKGLESIYAKTRILNKPDNYILDQDHHVHLANQSIDFGWQFYAEELFLKKLMLIKELKKAR